jgi:hypothetical protein
MPFIARATSDFENLVGQPKKANGQCVRLVQEVIPGMPLTAEWRAGTKVKGNLNITRGTAIATFVDGKYPNKPHGNHAALYIKQDAIVIWVIDQFVSNNPKHP